MRLKLADVLKWLYAEKQNYSVETYFGANWRFRLFDCSSIFEDLDDGAVWLLEEYLRQHPERSKATHEFFNL